MAGWCAWCVFGVHGVHRADRIGVFYVIRKTSLFAPHRNAWIFAGKSRKTLRGCWSFLVRQRAYNHA
ncbi:MAG: hypothetical protein CBB70_12810 [Planctomycetaceae bacterium TMED10]|nr:MAG: hypothetical protein CBB70_12810 [Planctomycetaceae bacterium TMED10]